MQDFLPLVILALQIGCVLLVAHLCLGDLLAFLGISRLKNGIDGGPEEAAAQAGLLAEDLTSQLAALDFVPVGVYWEKPDFGERFRELAFASKTDACFATIYGLRKNEPLRAAFLTAFTDGGVAFTQNYYGGSEAIEDDFHSGPPGRHPAKPRTASDDESPEALRRRSWARKAGHALQLSVAGFGILTFASGFEYPLAWLFLLAAWLAVFVVQIFSTPNTEQETPPEEEDLDIRLPLKDVLEEHRWRVRRLMLAGHTPQQGGTIEDFVGVQNALHFHPASQRQYRYASLIGFLSTLAYLVIGPGLVATFMEADHPAIWIVLLLQCLFMEFVLRYRLFRIGAKKSLAASPQDAAPQDKTQGSNS